MKAELKANTDAAIARGLFGVPSCEVDGKLFWGFDGLPMLREFLDGNGWFATGDWEKAASLPRDKPVGLEATAALKCGKKRPNPAW